MLDQTLARPRFKPVGITKGPGENTHEYTFVSRDDEQVLKNGEYVYYELTELGDVGVPLAGKEVRGTSTPPSPLASKEVPWASTLTSTLATRRVLGRIIKR